MRPLVDWISTTVPTKTRTDGSPQWLDPSNPQLCKREALARVSTIIGRNIMQTLFGDVQPGLDTGRYRYKYRIDDPNSGASLYFSPELTHMLIEAKGRACAALSENGQIIEFLALVGVSRSRLDVSADLATDTTPIEFARAGFSHRFSTGSQHYSDNGLSVYVGSPKSQRRAIIYRYQEPHPRAHLLRVEHRFKGLAAEDMAHVIVEHGVVAAVKAAGELFGWRHPLWAPPFDGDVELPRVTVGAKDTGVVRWLLTQVFPAMRKYEEDGRIDDLRAFVQYYLFDDHGHDE